MNKVALKNISTDTMETVAERFRALGEVSRLQILQALQSGEKNVSDLVNITGLSQPNVSRHLGVLVTSGLIARRKDGLNVIYKVADESLAEICDIVCKSVTSQSRNK